MKITRFLQSIVSLVFLVGLSFNSLASQSSSLSLECDLSKKSTAPVRRFWSSVNFEPQAAEAWAADANSRSAEDFRKRLPEGAPLSIKLGMALGGLPTSTLPGLNAREKEHTRNGVHIRANADKAFYDISTQKTDRRGKPRFIEVNGQRVPDCKDYYIGKTPESIGGAGTGGDPAVDTIDHPFVQFYECYKWDGKEYIYDWEPLERRLDATLKIAPISTIVPGVPWAFQRGMTFVKEGDPRALRRVSEASPAEYKGKLYTDTMRESPYGNELVPDRLDDYGKLLEAAVRHLATSPKYKNLVPNWKWKIGQEVDTRFYTRERYFEFFKTSEQAIRRVFPDAKIGVHFGQVDTDRGWLPSFLRFCRENKLRCDFVGASRYYQLVQPKKSSPEAIEEWLKAIPRMPNWPATAKLEIHEFGVDPVPDAKEPEIQLTPFYAMLADRVLRTPAFGDWVTVRKASDPCLTWLESVADWDLLESKINGRPNAQNACLGAIVARDPKTGDISALIYNYNPESAEAQDEKIRLEGLRGISSLQKPEIQIQRIRYDQTTSSENFVDLKNAQLTIKSNSVAILKITLAQAP